MGKRGSLRASDADRDQVVDRLREASAEGRLAVHELEHRVAIALRARTYAELDETVRDLPGKPLGGRPSAPRRAMRTVQAHPALLLIAIPVALLTVATLLVITVLWSAFVVVVFLLGHRRYRVRGPWMYGARHHVGPVHGAPGCRPRWL